MLLANIISGDRMVSLKDKLKDIERVEIINALEDCNWVMARAARILGITERMIGYKVKKYSIKKEVEGNSREVSVNKSS